MKKSHDVLNDPFLNKGTAFTLEERAKLGLIGLLPACVQTLEEQSNQAYAQYQKKDSNIEKRHFLMEIFNTNRTLFYALFSRHVVEFMPIVYDPTIAESINRYDELFVDPQYAAYLSINEPENIEATLKNAANGRDIKLIVATDAEGILGIGDWGVNGVDISVGKLMVYTAAAGIDPNSVLPVVLDVGTNREQLLNDPLYLGNRHQRVRGDQYYEFVDQFVQKAEALFPKLYLHWEDFGRSNAANILNKYRDKIATFNDDIQGTGIITLAGILGALNISKQNITDQTYMCFGAGSAGAGITNRIYQEMLQHGLSEKEARAKFYMVDVQGLLFDDMDDLTPEQRPFARSRAEFANSHELTSLEAAIKAVHPTILVGTSTCGGAFTETLIKEMAAHTERPIIFPLSNPTELAEATAKDLLTWTDGRALVATGIPTDPVELNGVTYEIGQANNALIYPGLGLGVLASQARILNDTMISKAAHSLGGLVDPSKAGAAVLPPVSKLVEFSRTVAKGVAQSAVDQKLNKHPIADLDNAIDELKWIPEYQDLTK
ncbi:NAD-dependent malic enzyme [Pasteurellaceae bacterium USgator11]|nr:NAD-dependent malic enzyme [Pasteurellaceae bacterium UScroc12]TNG98482.1 NAD-dependent malic enzyme [Pasteurellaceae bacterium UScroc31]TNG98641.1 NAD-dependent malic enzyme [Pasteurellaceae bacterium USgator41]TNH03352.1 NAD-dependent malic enzyme [Pasteurellaceae bacterium USgator11]